MKKYLTIGIFMLTPATWALAQPNITNDATAIKLVARIQAFKNLKEMPHRAEALRFHNEYPGPRNAGKDLTVPVQSELLKPIEPGIQNITLQGNKLITTTQMQQPATLSSSTGIQFQGAAAGASVPADVSLAAGWEHLVQMTNNSFNVYNKNGTLVDGRTLDGFWSVFNNTTFFDPKIVYDYSANRWIAICPYNPRATTSAIAVAISSNWDPTGGWLYFSVDADPNNNEWFDYPSLGYTTDKIVFSGNMLFLPNAQGSSINTGSRTYVIDKNLVYAGTVPSSVRTHEIAYTDAVRNVHPSINIDLSATSYCIETSVGSNRYSLYHLTGAPASTSFSYIGEIDFSANSFENGTVDAPQLGTTAKLDLGFSWIKANVLRHGNLYFTNNYSHTNPDRAGFQAYWVNASSRQGTSLIWESNNPFYGYPNLAVNRRGDIVGSVGIFNSTIYPSTGYFYVQAGNVSNGLFTIKSGENFVANTDSRGRNRWGDYTGAAVDAADDESFWVSNDYGSTPNFRTWISKIVVNCDAVQNVNVAVNSGQMKKIVAQDIQTTATLNSGSTVKLQGANIVTLQPGFLAVAGSDAKIYIAPCGAEVNMNQ